jgi:molybdopterin/thiamine biosynthesis adenylyltransferase
MLLQGFGEDAQRALLDATAVLLGCGALGAAAADALARAGVGHLVIIDRDFVELTNLQRQVLFDERDAAEALPKAEAARRRLARVNSQVRVTAVVDDINHSNIERLTAGADVLIDGLDNFETRYLANDCAVKHSCRTRATAMPTGRHQPAATSPRPASAACSNRHRHRAKPRPVTRWVYWGRRSPSSPTFRPPRPSRSSAETSIGCVRTC